MLTALTDDELAQGGYRFEDLQARRIITNRTDLSRKQRELGFPLPVKTGNSQAMFLRVEVHAWLRERLALRPAPKHAGASERRSASRGVSRATPSGTEEATAARESRAGRGGSATTCTCTTTTAATLAARQLGFAPRGRAKAPRCRMSDRTARGRVLDLTPEMPFRRSDGIEVVRLDELERMVRSGPITGYAPWAPKIKVRHQSVGRHWRVRAGSVRPQDQYRPPLRPSGSQQARGAAQGAKALGCSIMSETIELAIVSKMGGPLTKRITLTADGKIASDGSACTMARGRAKRKRIGCAGELHHRRGAE